VSLFEIISTLVPVCWLIARFLFLFISIAVSRAGAMLNVRNNDELRSMFAYTELVYSDLTDIIHVIEKQTGSTACIRSSSSCILPKLSKMNGKKLTMSAWKIWKFEEFAFSGVEGGT
jgi:hypothetical protein